MSASCQVVTIWNVHKAWRGASLAWALYDRHDQWQSFLHHPSIAAPSTSTHMHGNTHAEYIHQSQNQQRSGQGD